MNQTFVLKMFVGRRITFKRPGNQRLRPRRNFGTRIQYPRVHFLYDVALVLLVILSNELRKFYFSHFFETYCKFQCIFISKRNRYP